MRWRGLHLAGIGTLLAAACVAVGSSRADPGDSLDFAVERTFNGAPFRCRMAPAEGSRDYRLFRLSYPSPVKTPVEQNNTVPAEYYVPDGAGDGPRRPAVIVLHILNGNYELERMLCAALATRGIPAVMFKLPYYGERGLPGGRDELLRRPALFIEALPQGILDARRTIDVLAARPEVDPERIGVAGISLGGIVAATAAGSDARVHRAALLLTGGDLLAVIHHCREARDLSRFLKEQTPEARARLEKAVAGVDPLAAAEGLRERARAGRVMMVNATEDDVIPRACTDRLAAALGMADEVVWLEGLGHYTAIAALPQTLARTVDFFALDLPEGVKTPAVERPAPGTPAQTLATLVQQAASFVTTGPREGRCRLADVAVSVTDKSGKKHDGRLRVVRGRGHRFRIEVKAPVVGEAALGQGDRPWIASATRAFVGEAEEGAESADPLAFADPKRVARLKTVAAGFSGLLLVPGMLEQALEIADDTRPDGPPAVRVTLRDKKRDWIRLVLVPDRSRPASATFDVDGVRGEVTFHAWQPDTVAPEGLFAPPVDKTRREVDAADLRRIFSAMFDFLMEMTE